MTALKYMKNGLLSLLVFSLVNIIHGHQKMCVK